MNQLRLYLLGQFKVLVDDKLISDFATDATRALLSYLVIRPEQLHEREHLAQLLWGEESHEKGLTNLRTTLSRLRMALGDENQQNPLLLVTRQAIGVNPTVELWVDLLEVHKLARKIRQHEHSAMDRCPLCADKIRQIVELYQGTFLAGLHVYSIDFDHWQRTYQESLHDTLLGMLKVLTDFHLHRNEFTQAIGYARQQLAIDTWDERAYQQLMEGLSGNGQRSAAMAQYKRCRSVLQAEFGALPNATTEALYEKIRQDTNQHPAPTLGVHTLPPTTTLYGREREMEWLLDRLVSPRHRLVTIVGMSGIGKTRLAIALAHALKGCFRDGVWFVSLVELEPSSSPEITCEAIASKIADVLMLPQTAERSRRHQLLTVLAQKSILLVLDNFEHLINSNETLSELLKTANGLTLLVTSRTRLELAEQIIYPLEGLPYPQKRPVTSITGRQPAHPESDAALKFFLDSAQRVRPTFAITEHSEEYGHFLELCSLVQGLPLALELSAAWVDRQSLAELTQQISIHNHTQQQREKAGSSVHSILDSVFDTTWQLLDPAAQLLFKKLTVFAGSIDPAAAQEIANASDILLETLLRHLFITLDPLQNRYQIHPLLHKYGWKHLLADEQLACELQNRHAAYYCQWLNTLQILLKSADTQRTLNLMTLELGNLRRAWQWAGTRQHIAWLHQAMESLNIFYLRQHRYQEGVQICAESLTELAPINDFDGLTVRAMLLVWQGRFLQILGRDDSANQQNREAMRLIESAIATESEQKNRRLPVLAAVLAQRGHLTVEDDPTQATSYFQQALDLYRACKDRWDEANMLAALARCAQMTGNFEEAERYDSDALTLRTEMGDPATIAVSWLDLGVVAMEQGRFENAEELFLHASQLFQSASDAYGHARSIGMLGLLYRRSGKKEEALQFLLRSVAQLGELQRPVEQSEFLIKAASLAIELGQTVPAVDYLQQVLKLASEAQIQPLVAQTERLLLSLTPNSLESSLTN